jgi:hypothetical protein
MYPQMIGKAQAIRGESCCIRVIPSSQDPSIHRRDIPTCIVGLLLQKTWSDTSPTLTTTSLRPSFSPSLLCPVFTPTKPPLQHPAAHKPTKAVF